MGNILFLFSGKFLKIIFICITQTNVELVFCNLIFSCSNFCLGFDEYSYFLCKTPLLPNMIVYAYNFSILEAEAGGFT